MKKFKFKFQTLLKAREMAEDNARKEYFQAYEIVLREIQVWQKLLSDQEMLTQEYDQLKMDQDLKVQHLKAFNPILHALKKKEFKQMHLIEKLNAMLNEKKRLLAEKMKQKKIMSRLKELKHEQYQYELNMADQKLMDEIGVSRYIHEKFN